MSDTLNHCCPGGGKFSQLPQWQYPETGTWINTQNLTPLPCILPVHVVVFHPRNGVIRHMLAPYPFLSSLAAVSPAIIRGIWPLGGRQSFCWEHGSVLPLTILALLLCHSSPFMACPSKLFFKFFLLHCSPSSSSLLSLLPWPPFHLCVASLMYSGFSKPILAPPPPPSLVPKH